MKWRLRIGNICRRGCCGESVDLIIADDYDALSRAGASWLIEAIRKHPDAAIVAATGHTPMGMYIELAQRRFRDSIDTSRLRVFQLDAYLGLAPDDPRALFGWTRRSFIEPLGIAEANVVRLAGDAPDPWEACRRPRRMLQRGSST